MNIPELYSMDGLALIVGYLYAILSGIFLIPIMKLMREIIGDKEPEHKWQTGHKLQIAKGWITLNSPAAGLPGHSCPVK